MVAFPLCTLAYYFHWDTKFPYGFYFGILSSSRQRGVVCYINTDSGRDCGKQRRTRRWLSEWRPLLCKPEKKKSELDSGNLQKDGRREGMQQGCPLTSTGVPRIPLPQHIIYTHIVTGNNENTYNISDSTQD